MRLPPQWIARYATPRRSPSLVPWWIVAGLLIGIGPSQIARGQGYVTVGSALSQSAVQQTATAQPAQEPGNLPPALGPATPQPPAPPPNADQPALAPGPLDPDSAALDAIAANAQPLSLTEAIDLAFRTQPRLKVQLEAIEQARGLKGIAYSAFLPMASGTYQAGGIDLHTGRGKTNTIGSNGGAFSALPGLGVLPSQLVIESAVEVAEVQMQWLLLDFGRRLGAFEQAKLAGDIAQLQTNRAFQTVANDVATAYYAVLQARALRRTSAAALQRALADLTDARKLQREGAAVRETVLRAEVQAAETRQALRAAAETEFVALASLSLAIGLKGSGCVQVQEPLAMAELGCSLAQCLETATQRRFEFQVARRGVEIASAGTRIAKAEFAPKVAAEGRVFNLQQASPTIYADQVSGLIGLEWKFFEGGRKVASLRIADSKLRESMAQAETIADGIAFQVNEAYRRLITSRLGIDDSRPAVDQARENYRLVRARALEGNATPAEITDALASATRSEQNYYNSLYSYLTAYARLEYAMGTGQTPSGSPPTPSQAQSRPR